jgi:hypothetical protein
MKQEESEPPILPGYPAPGESKIEDLPLEWADEDRESEGRKPDLGEIEEDSSEL